MASVASPLAPALRDVSLQDKYLLPEGRVFLSGVQALVRVLLDQRRADVRAGLNTATFVSGYQGSPLGGFDKEIQRLRAVASEHEIFHQPGLNEELGATSVFGTQLAGNLPGPQYDGVIGVWYGKAPGVDRAADAIRHGNFAGTSPTGGVLALAGDDPSCKSSTLPSSSTALLASMHVPTLYPGNIQEVLDLGRHAIACSRASGLWCALKVTTEVADAAGTAIVGLDRVVPAIPSLDWDGKPYVHQPSAHLLAPDSLEMERTLFGIRLELAKHYARLNGLNPVTHDAPNAWLGLVASGKTYFDLMQALDDLGLDDGDLRDAGVRILKLGMAFPVDEEALRNFAAGLDEVLILEEKLPFVEDQIKVALYGLGHAPLIVGKRDETGAPLVPDVLDLDADILAHVFARRLSRRVEIPRMAERIAVIDEVLARPAPELAQRTPFFCSGCPHNSSTPAISDDTLVGGGIGCHTMILLNPEKKGRITGITQMGGEGAQWIGMAPFTERPHFFQNLGDGTFHHSGSLAVRAAVAAGVNITYKLFYNGTVAMTGGQDIEGVMSVPALTHWLALEGVTRTIVTTEDTDRYRGVELAANAELRPRSELLAAQKELAQVEGTTMLIHDQACAAELRRLRKRGKAVDPPTRVLINERVCEGCGDCGEKSGCLSVEPVETEFGRKTRIHQASCNKDYSCLEGDCPSFLTVIPAANGKPAKREKPAIPLPEVDLPEPELRVPAEDFRVRLVGIGGTGVVTVSQVIGMAALLDGLHATGLDQTGLSQKGGPVVSDVRIAARPISGANRSPAGGADLLLGLDLLGTATAKNLSVADPQRTVAVISTSAVPTGKMVLDTTQEFPALEAPVGAIEAVTRAGDNVFLDVQAISQAVFGDHMPGNVIGLGAAWQQGALPLSHAALRQAFTLNGAGVEANLAAFEWGRACVAAPEVLEGLLAPRKAPEPTLSEADHALVQRVTPEAGELHRVVAIRVPELVAFQNRAYAERYVDEVARVKAIEQERLDGATELTEAFARNLYKLMAYKDEYEVARLHIEQVSEARVHDAFGKGTKVYFNLHPPLLRALGLKHKLKLGTWFLPAFRLMYRMRGLRGRALDPFGKAKVRRVERALVGEYLELVDAALERLSPATAPVALELCELPDVIRGYEDIKLANVERFRERAAQLRAQLG